MLGHQVGAPEDQNKSLQERATNPYHYAEFLPGFAIRPMYKHGSVFGFQAGAGSSPRRCSYLGDLTILAWHSPFLVADEIFGLLPCILCGFGDDDY